MANALAVAGPNSKYSLPGAEPAGFLAGLWHGLISPIVFIVSLFVEGEPFANYVAKYFENSWNSEYAEDVDPCETYDPPRISE